MTADELRAIREEVAGWLVHVNADAPVGSLASLARIAQDLIAEVERLQALFVGGSAGVSQETLTVVCARCFHALVVGPHVQRVVNSPVYCSREECSALDGAIARMTKPSHTGPELAAKIRRFNGS